ncbi:MULTISPECIES: NAD-dependent epimerase/dehydratase family protein [unclassified Francisella]|uniref:NAD-dependent epimerase/dehydratase family protein n=1 Tax=unclassified Francisella TaxID=2610885 RepID=UPI002E3037A8|nr:MULTISPECIES: NAD-dependent epimerase/dehydratase family protein [unclassified Francisella]MED7818483.1 NAD-dependent epimerase/dehydratase family protein [Francisella sp. 19S2-4]MED7829262.1 NAD-dependent epimerase/dehydratase family protein [Francisella sp. 19S2-10]
MLNIDTSSPVLVTGATGYVASWIIKELLENGVDVHAAVRNPLDTDKNTHLDKIAKNSPGTIKYFKADLLNDGSFAEAMEGCSIVFHTASPFKLNVNDPQKDLIDPAKFGTHNVLSQASKTSSVRRVVLTSSCAAIFSDNKDLENTPLGIFTEEIWNTSSTVKHNPYSLSKTLAEKEAWNIAKNQNQWDLVTINPTLVMGPGLNPKATSESFNLIRQLGDGTMKAGVPNLGLGIVDVRDVAKAHIAAAFIPDANGRYIISGHNTSLPEMVKLLLPHFGDKYPLPKKVLPKSLVWLFGPMTNSSLTRKFISKNVNYPWIGDNLKSVRELGMTYRSLSETMNDFFQQMIDSSQI